MIRIALMLVLLFATPAVASAGVFDVFGLGSRNIAMGNASTATATDHTATFYNPAMLSVRKKVQISASFFSLFNDVSIEQPTPSDDIYAGQDPDNQLGVSFGVIFPFGGKIDNRIAFGLSIYIPVEHVLALNAPNPETPRWLMYNNLLDKLHILAGVSGEVTEWLSLGLGFQTLAAIDGDIGLDVDILNNRISRRDVLAQLLNTGALIAGVLIRPIDGLNIGLSWRGPMDLSYTFPLKIGLGGIDLDIDIEGTDLYTPHTFSLGVAYTLPMVPVLIALDARFALWSQAPDPSLFVAFSAAGEIPEELSLDEALTFDSGRPPNAGFQDAWSLHIGSEYHPLTWLLLRAGYSWRQAITPPQTGATSYLDTDAHTPSLGVAFSFPDPLELNDSPVTFDLAAAATIHPELDVEKSAPGDPIGRLRYGGVMYVLSTSIRHDF